MFVASPGASFPSCSDSYFFRNITHQDIDKLDVHQSVGHHNRSYSNPAEYILVFTGGRGGRVGG
jgi:hypothetical protein